MAYLITHNDPFHAHSICGVLVLLQFLIRWFWIIVFGSAWRDFETTNIRIATLLIHFMTPLLSFQLHLPLRRNMSAPMICPEFRYHSFIFSMRHISSCIGAFIFKPYQTRLFQFIISQATMTCATAVTSILGDNQKRTTNAMPYPESLSKNAISDIKNFYTYAQMFATAMSISGNADLAYMPLLAIQIAPFLMTLVRKQLISTTTYHIIYSYSLAAPVFGMIVISFYSVQGLQASYFSLICGLVARHMRVKHGFNKHITWFISPVTGWIITNTVTDSFAMFSVIFGGTYMILVFLVRTLPLSYINRKTSSISKIS